MTDHLDKKIYEKLKEKMGEMASLPPHPLGRWSPYYHEAAPFFKVAPWKLGFLFALLTTLFLLVSFGSWFVRFASFLSRGF